MLERKRYGFSINHIVNKFESWTLKFWSSVVMRHEIIILILLILVPSSSLQCTMHTTDCEMIKIAQKMKTNMNRKNHETTKPNKKMIRNLDKFIGFYQVPLSWIVSFNKLFKKISNTVHILGMPSFWFLMLHNHVFVFWKYSLECIYEHFLKIGKPAMKKFTYMNSKAEIGRFIQGMTFYFVPFVSFTLCIL